MVAKNRKRGRTANNRFPKMLPKRRTFGKRKVSDNKNNKK